MQNFDELWLLLFKEVNLWVLAQLQGIYETRVLNEATTVKRLNLQSSLEPSPFTLLLLPVSVHVAEDDSCVVPLLDLLRWKKQVFIARVCEQVFQVLHELSALEPPLDVPLDVESGPRSLLEVELEEVTRFVASEQALNQDWGTVTFKATLQTVNVDFQIEFMLLGARLITVVS